MKDFYLNLVLNAHLPFVRHPEYPEFFEENWLFEALSETYLPLLRVFHRLEEDQVPFKLTMSFSPTLTAMLGDPLLQDRYLKHLDNQLELAEKEILRTQNDPLLNRLARDYKALYLANQGDFQDVYQGNVLRGFGYFQKKGHLEILTTAATHALMPLYEEYPEALHAQLQVAVDSHYQAFSRPPKGIWLPECGYFPGLEKLLARHKLKYFFSSAHGALSASQFPERGVFGPLSVGQGVAAFPRDLTSTNQVWSKDEGYPGDPVYRDFYRDIGYDLDWDYIKPHLHGALNRVATGFKYWAVTGKTDQKVYYQREKALAKVQEHAENFLYNRLRQGEKLHQVLPGDRPPLITSPFDAELFGHWWFEGPLWLEAFFRAAEKESALKLITPSEYLDLYPENQEVQLSFSTWGTGGFAEVWVDGANDWILRHTHRAVDRMRDLVQRYPNETGRKERALNQAAREVLLSQASDWPLILKMGTAAQYALTRIQDHVSNFTRIYDSLSANDLDTEWLTTLEKKNNLFPKIDYRVFRKLPD